MVEAISLSVGEYQACCLLFRCIRTCMCNPAAIRRVVPTGRVGGRVDAVAEVRGQWRPLASIWHVLASVSFLLLFWTWKTQFTQNG